jgi:hypothetical protein
MGDQLRSLVLQCGRRWQCRLDPISSRPSSSGERSECPHVIFPKLHVRNHEALSIAKAI